MFGFGESDQRELLHAAFRYAFSLTHHEYDAEDLVQSAWLKLLSMNAKVPEKNLLFVAVRHLFFDDRRRAKIVTFCPIDDEEPAFRQTANLGVCVPRLCHQSQRSSARNLARLQSPSCGGVPH
jgi:DNA-directed RNA polymerase specialized sigma24 family protein